MVKIVEYSTILKLHLGADGNHAGEEDDGIHFYKTRKNSGRETHHLQVSVYTVQCTRAGSTGAD